MKDGTDMVCRVGYETRKVKKVLKRSLKKVILSRIAAGRRKIMKKAAAWALALGLWVTAAGCSPKTSAFPPNQNAIYVSRDGGLYTAIIEEYDPSDTGYSAQELRAMAEAELSEYNGEFASGADSQPVSVVECTVAQGKASIVYQYAGPEDLCRFTDMSQDAKNHPESLLVTTNSAGIDGEDGGTWTDARKKEVASLETVMKRKDLPMVVAEGTVTVQTEGRILYYSGAVELRDEYTAQVTGGTAYIVFR